MIDSAIIKVCPSCHGDSPGDAPACVRCGVDLGDLWARTGEELVGLEIAGKYKLEEVIGEGSMGWVYRALHRTLRSDVAVKLMKPAGDDPERQQRFEREARVASRLTHPHVISVTDFGHTSGGLLYIVSEFIRGQQLTDLIGSPTTMPIGRALTIFHQLLAAVEEAHGSGLVHRDIKPDNIMITPLRSGEDFVKVLDFGIAQLVDVSESPKMTAKGEVCGTPAYMAPEQIRGQEVTPRSDLYSCGLVLYELLTHRKAFDTNRIVELLEQQLHAIPMPIRAAAPEQEYPEALEAVVSRCLAKDPAARFGSVSELRGALFSSVEDIRQAEVPCISCRERSGSSWTVYCNKCGFRPSYASLSGPLVEHIDEPHAAQDGATVPPSEAEAADAETTAVTLQIRDSGERDEGLTTQLIRARPFVGRDRELAEVDRFLSSTDTVLEVVGGPGSGKTALLGRIAARVRWRCLTAGADGSLAGTPWHPIRRLVSQVLRLDSERPELRELRERAIDAGLAAEDVPGLVDLFGLAHTAEQASGEVRLREAWATVMRVLLASRMARRGFCILLDDVDEFDGASLAAVRQLTEVIRPGKVKVVLASKRSLLPGDGAQASVYLGPLAVDAIEALVGKLAPSREDPAGLARSLLARSDGNPLHVAQLIRLASEGGPSVDGVLQDVVRARLTLLSEPALELLQILCLIGDRAELELAAGLLADNDDFVQAAGELAERGFLEPRWTNGLIVTSPTVAEAVRVSTDHRVLQDLSRQLLGHLEASGAGVIARARHAFEAKLGETGLRILQEAGELTSYWLDDEGAAMHFRRGLDIARWELLLGEEDERLPLLSLKLGDALRRSRHYLAAEMVYKEALSAAGRHPALRARLLSGLAKLLVKRELGDEGIKVMRQALTQAHATSSPALLAEMYTVLSDLLERLGMTDSAAAEFDEAIFLVTGGDGMTTGVPPRGFWRLLARAAEVRSRVEDASLALELASLALHHAHLEKSLPGQARCQLLMAQMLDDETQLAQFEDHCAAALAAFKRLGDRRSVAECLLLQATRRPAAAPELLQQAIRLSQQIDWTEGVDRALRIRARG